MIWAYLIILSLGTILNLYIPKNEAIAKDSIVIPGEAIRLRILANSDTEADQALKRKVRDAVNAQITLWVQDLTSMEKARTVIKAKLPTIQEIAERVVADQGSDQSVKVVFGKVQFPTKLYGQFLYPAGEYQAILITLGEGKGANWWCVLYPPLCFLDFSNGVAVSDGFDAAEPKVASKEQASKPVTDVASVAEEQASKQGTDVASVKEEQASKQVSEQAPVKKEKAAQIDRREKSVSVQNSPTDTATNTSNPHDVEKDNIQTDSENDNSHTINKEVQKPVHAKKEKVAPVYTSDDEQPVKVKFFVVEVWHKIFN